jgi:hypothetical protein
LFKCLKTCKPQSETNSKSYENPFSLYKAQKLDSEALVLRSEALNPHSEALARHSEASGRASFCLLNQDSCQLTTLPLLKSKKNGWIKIYPAVLSLL